MPSINLTFMCFRKWSFLQCERGYRHVRLTFDVRPSINLTFMCFRNMPVISLTLQGRPSSKTHKCEVDTRPNVKG
jgi:hypothetical protein